MTGWMKAELGAIASIGAGNSAPQDPRLFVDGRFPFFRTSDIGRIRAGDIVAATDNLNDEGIRGLRRFPKGTILFPKSGASTFLNHRVMMAVDGFVSSHLATILANPAHVDSRFLLHYLTTIRAQDLVQDHAYPSLNLSLIAGIEVPLPPIHEQQRIVAILDEAFEGIATTKTNAEKNLQNSRDLLSTHLESTFSTCGPKWRMERLDALTILARGHNPPKSKFSNEPKPGYVRFYQIRDGSSEKHAVYVPDTPQLHKMKRDDIMMVAYRHVGRVFRGVEGAFNVALCKIGNANREILHDDFLFHVLTSRHVKGELLKRSERSLIPSMSIEHLRELRIPLPPLSEQQKIVDRITIISDECSRLESTQSRKLDALVELKKSLLHQAFTGQL
jgi:type I restriction enzyme, S subunit